MADLNDLLRKNKAIEKIWIDGNKITDEGVKILLKDSGKFSFKLEEISLAKNEFITMASFPYLVNAFEHKIMSVALDGTQITKKDVLMLELIKQLVIKATQIKLSNKFVVLYY